MNLFESEVTMIFKHVRRFLDKLFASKDFKLAIGPFGGLLSIFVCRICHMQKDMANVIGLCVWMIIWWLNETVRMGVTALLPIVMLPLSGVVSGGEISSSYFSDGVMVSWGSMVMTGAIEKYQLHVRIANWFLKSFKNASLTAIIFGFVIITGFVSCWMSNTATAALMCPLARAVFLELRMKPDVFPLELLDSAAAAVDLGIAWGSTLGGMATLTGTGANLVLQGNN